MAGATALPNPRRQPHTTGVTAPAPPAPPPDALALLAHELRTPLNALIGYAEAMRLQAFGPLAAPYDAHADVIHRAALHLLALVDDMTDIGHAEAGLWRGRSERLDPAVLASEAVELLAPRAAAAGVRLETVAEPGLIAVQADRRALRQILFNVLDNALKFAGAGGQVRLTVSREGADLRLTVIDGGGGGGSPGGGLGLRLVKALCAAHGGTLVLESAAEGGMTAVVTLPVIAEP